MIPATDTTQVSRLAPCAVRPCLGSLARKQAICVLFIGLFAFAGSAIVGAIVGIPEPSVRDEFSYLLAADTFAHGRLTNPTHPMWLFLESGHIIHQPTYMSKYPPAQGLVLAIGQVVAGQPIFGVWLSFGFMCAAITWMLYAWVPPRWALVGGLFAAINPYLGFAGYWAQSYWGGAVAATGGALVFGSLRRIIQRARIRDSFLMGLGLAILANSRPYEGLVASLPAGVTFFAWILHQRGPQLWRSIRRTVIPLSLVLAVTGAALAIYNLRITGNAFLMPFQVYATTYEIVPKFIWQSLRPDPVFYHEFMRLAAYGSEFELYKMEHTVLGFLVKNLATLPWWILYSLNVFILPIIVTFSATARWAWRTRWGQFALITYAVFIVGMFLEVPMMIHYWAPITGLNYLFMLQALRLSRWDKSKRKWKQHALPLVVILAAGGLVISLYRRLQSDDPTEWYRQRAFLLRQLTKAEGQHLIVVSYGPNHSIYKEWVYNEADIDAAKVVWARSMNTAENCKLVQYFHRRHIWKLHIDDDRSIFNLEPYPTSFCQ